MSDWQEALKEYMNSEEGKDILHQIRDYLIVRERSLSKMKDFSVKFISSQEYKDFWDNKESMDESSFIEFLEKNFGEQLIDALKTIAVAHISLSMAVNNYARGAISTMLDEIGVNLFVDCMKEMSIEKKDNLLDVIFERLDAIILRLGKAIIGGFISQEDEKALQSENATLH